MTFSAEPILSKIYQIKGYKVMIDRDLADLYGVETRVLNQAVKRHKQRFLADFMFRMTKDELKHWKSQIVISNIEKKNNSLSISPDMKINNPHAPVSRG